MEEEKQRQEVERTKGDTGRKEARKREKSGDAKFLGAANGRKRERKNITRSRGEGKAEKAAVRMKGDRGRSPPFQEPL